MPCESHEEEKVGREDASVPAWVTGERVMPSEITENKREKQLL